MKKQEYIRLINILSHRLAEAYNHYAIKSENANIIAVTDGIMDVMDVIRKHFKRYQSSKLPIQKELLILTTEIKILTVSRKEYAYQGMIQLALDDIKMVFSIVNS